MVTVINAKAYRRSPRVEEKAKEIYEQLLVHPTKRFKSGGRGSDPRNLAVRMYIDHLRQEGTSPKEAYTVLRKRFKYTIIAAKGVVADIFLLLTEKDG